MADVACTARVAARAGISVQEAAAIIDEIDNFRQQIATEVDSATLAAELDNFARKAAGVADMEARALRREKIDNTLKSIGTAKRVNEIMNLTGEKSYTAALAADVYDTGRVSQGLIEKFRAPYVRYFQQHPEVEHLLRRDSASQKEFVVARHKLSAGEAMPQGGNKEIWDFADIVNRNEEKMRLMANRSGAQIGKLDGYGGTHVHDAGRIARDRAGHAQSLRDNVDWDKSFPWLEELAGLPPSVREDAINDIIDKIQGNIINGKMLTDTVNANDYVRGISKRYRFSSGMERERVLIFKDPESWLAYDVAFGENNVLGSVAGASQRMAERIAIMSKYGTRPEATLTGLAQMQANKLKASANKFAPEVTEEIKRLGSQKIGDNGGDVGTAWAVISGADRVPENITAARFLAMTRYFTSMSKLGGAVISSIGDLPVAVMTYKTKYGMNLLQAWGHSLRAFFNKVPAELRQEMAGSLDAFTDAFRSYNGTRIDGTAEVSGTLAKFGDTFFKWSGLTPWTNNFKAGHTHMLSEILGKNSSKAFADLNQDLRWTFQRGGIGEKEWDLIRTHMTYVHDGKTYILPNRAQDIPDAAVDSIGDTQARIDSARTKAAAEGWDATETVEKIRQKVRDNVDRAIYGFFSEQVNTLQLTPGARTRRWQTGGYRPGTLGGETMRFASQFRGFPIAFVQDILAPMFRGRPYQTRGNKISNVALLIAQTSFAGYVSMELKRMVRGEKPYFMNDQAEADWKGVALASMAQGGGLGIFGDFLLQEQNRFGGGLGETLAGPAVGTVNDLWRTVGIVTGTSDATASEAYTTISSNIPYINMWYTRALLDYSIGYSFREMLSPGWMKRREKQMKKDGREYFFPPRKYAARPFG
jgi:hypothetical protein